MVTLDASAKLSVVIQTEEFTNNASVITSNLSTSKRSKLMLSTIDNKSSSEEIREDLHF